MQKLTGFIEHLSSEGCIEDGTLASDLTKVCELLHIVVLELKLFISLVGQSPMGHQGRDYYSFST